MIAESDFDNLVSGFYRAAGGLMNWNDALEAVRQAMSAYVVHLFALDLSQGSVVFSYETGDRATRMPESILDYICHYHRLDPHTKLLLDNEAGTWVNTWERFDEAYVATDPFYQEFLIPNGGRYVSGTKLLQDGPICAIMGLHRGLGSPILSAEETAICQRLAHHLTEALRLDQLYLKLRQAGTLGVELLAQLRAPVALLDDRRRLLHANPAARALLAGSEDLVESDGHLFCHRQEDDHTLIKALRALHLADGPAPDEAATDKAFLRTGPVGLVLVALRPQATLGAFGDRSLAMMLFHQTGTRVELDPFVVAAFFDLTPAEARLAVALARGESTEAIAKRCSVSINTIRSQRQSILAKTGATRQAELVSILASLPTATLGC